MKSNHSGSGVHGSRLTDEKCDPAAGEIPLSVPLLAGNCEPDNLNITYHL